MSSDHIYFAYYYLKRDEEDSWNKLSLYLGTEWNLNSLRTIQKNSAANSSTEDPNVFVPLSLVINPELPDILLGNKKQQNSAQRTDTNGDGLFTGMPLPADADVVNMANLTQDEFIDLIAKAGLQTKRKP